MTDKSNQDEKKEEVKTSERLSMEKVNEKTVTSFEDLENIADEEIIETPTIHSSFDEPLSLAEEEQAASADKLEGFTLPDLENSFAAANDVDEKADTNENEPSPFISAKETAALTTELNELDDLPIKETALQDVEIIMNPVFEEALQKKTDPFPLPEALLLHTEVLDEPSTDAKEPNELELDISADLSLEEPFEPLMAPDVELDVDVSTSQQSTSFSGVELDIADDVTKPTDNFDSLPDLAIGGFKGDETEDNLDEKFFRETIRLSVDDLYSNVLKTLYECDDIGVDAAAKARVGQSLKLKKLPQMICRDLVIQKVVNPVQLARAIARTQRRKEITSFLNIPHESMGLRQALDSRVCALLREARVIPLWHKLQTEEDSQSVSELHLAHEAPTKNLVLEAAISELLPDHKFVWHFALRDVCGAYWLSGEDEDVDSNMEADALLDRIVGNAIDARSSDIHIDPSIKGDFKAMVRYRVDGFVQSKEVITLDQLQRLRIRIENIARMPKVDLHHPNKGAFTRSGYDWRIQIQPHAGRQGPLPRIVIRRLNPDVMTMEELGYPDYFTQYVKEASKSPNGVILWTGPTGSGKTESIHSAIVSANPMGRGLSVHTIEDPPEKRVAGYAVQMEISERDPARSGMELLKSSLRADPDVIVFGEVRDAEMAGLVFEAANTGHLVFSTLHTNTALDAIVRLDELEIYGFNISYVRGIAAQRLVRRLCAHCKQPINEADEYTRYVFDKFTVDLEGAKLFTHDPSGCPSCNFTGYHGRIAIAEWLAPNSEIVNLSVERRYTSLEEVAKRAGWKPMGYMGVLHLKNGITDVHELASKVQELAGDL